MKCGDRLIDLVPNDMVRSEKINPTSISEILLRGSQELHRLLTEKLELVGFMIIGGMLTSKYIVVGRRQNPDLKIRLDVLRKLEYVYGKSTVYKWLWPPKRELIWDANYRSFFSVMEIPPNLVRKDGITSNGSQKRTIRESVRVRVGPTTKDIAPRGPFNRLPTPIFNSPSCIPQLNVLYRGTPHLYTQELSLT